MPEDPETFFSAVSKRPWFISVLRDQGKRRFIKQAELRRDYIQEKYVIIAPRRAKRPHLLERPEVILRTEKCVLCPESLRREKILTRLSMEGERPWSMAVVLNKFPAVSQKNKQAYGIQEIVVETPHPEQQLDELSAERISALLKLYAERTKVIERDRRIEYIIILKNNGGRAGASIVHSHSQIFATNFIPPHLLDKSQKVFEYRLHYGSCVYCDVIREEVLGPRLVYEDKNVVAFCPYASMHNYEIWILPKRHLDNIKELQEKERLSWALILKKILKAVNQLGMPYNYYFHQIVHDKDQHLYMKITPRGSVWAGVEIGSGIIINPIAPEEAAEYYRKKFRTLS